MIGNNNLHTTEQCDIYYEIARGEINLILKQNRFPYNKARINVYDSWYSDLFYDDVLDMIIDGGEEYMLDIIRKKVREIIRDDSHYNATQVREEQVLHLGSTVNIDKDIWKKLRDGY